MCKFYIRIKYFLHEICCMLEIFVHQLTVEATWYLFKDHKLDHKKPWLTLHSAKDGSKQALIPTQTLQPNRLHTVSTTKWCKLHLLWGNVKIKCLIHMCRFVLETTDLQAPNSLIEVTRGNILISNIGKNWATWLRPQWSSKQWYPRGSSLLNTD